MKAKKLISGVLSIGMLINIFCVPALAATPVDSSTAIQAVNLEEEINRAYNGITDIPITDEMKSGISATMTTAENGVIPVDVYCTVREIQSTSEGTTYALTAVASSKTQSGVADTSGNINVRVSATMYWTDNLGVNNTMDRITGQWNCYDSCYVTNRHVWCLARPWNLDYGGLEEKKYDPSSNSFDYSFTLNGTYLTADISAHAYNASGSDYQVLILSLAPTILD